MKKFHPPIQSRKNKELVVIAHCEDEDVWQREATVQAKIELENRKVPIAYQDDILKKEERSVERIKRWKTRTKEFNKRAGYEKWELIVVFLLGPVLFLRPYMFNSHSMFSLYRDRFYLKLKQRIALILISSLFWWIVINYSIELSEKKGLRKLKMLFCQAINSTSDI